MKKYVLMAMTLMGTILHAGKIAYIDDARKKYHELRADKMRLDCIQREGGRLNEEKRKKMHELARTITKETILLNEHRMMHGDESVKKKELEEIINSIKKYGKRPYLRLNISL